MEPDNNSFRLVIRGVLAMILGSILLSFNGDACGQWLVTAAVILLLYRMMHGPRR